MLSQSLHPAGVREYRCFKCVAGRVRQVKRSRWVARGVAALTFYTGLPVPQRWPSEFYGIAAFAPLVGLGIGGLLALEDWGLAWLGMPVLTRSALVIATGLGITGGLHLDGAMDTADGLAVQDPQRRLAVMADSRTGAFGAMAAVVILGLKTLALADLETSRGLALMAAAGWGRWGQLMAIALYPYLKPMGKGAFHRATLQLPGDLWPGTLGMVGLLGLWCGGNPAQWPVGLGVALAGSGLALALGAWIARQLGGHTGDTYGAVVEWTEALLLCLITLIAR